MKKQPLDIHPVDQFMQALDTEIQPVMNEFHWTGMQALLDENFPQDELPAAGAAQSDSKPETGAGKAVKRFKWIFLGGIALIATMAGTQWNAMAIQNSELKQEMNIRGSSKIPEESSTNGVKSSVGEMDELKLKSESAQDQNYRSGEEYNKETSSEAYNSDLNQLNFGQEQRDLNLSNEKINLDFELSVDSVAGKKQLESVSDTAIVKKKKFIFW